MLVPESTTKEHLSGRIVPQSGSDLDTIGQLFSGFLAGENQTLSVVGESVQPSGSNGPVTWLSTAFKTLTLSVILPGQKSNVRFFPLPSATNSYCASQYRSFNQSTFQT